MIYYKKSLFLLLGATVLMAYSCQQEDIQMEVEKQSQQSFEVQQIPLEKALATLEEFMQNNESDMAATRSGSPRKIASISTYFGGEGSNVGTRTVAKEEIPDAYLVNFEDNEGFAVLGANTAVADIVAVTEGGQVMDDLTVVLEEGQNNELLDEEDDPYEIDEDLIDWYCEEDDDFYSATTDKAAFITECLKIGVTEGKNSDSTIYYSNKDSVDYYSEQIYTIKEPLLKTNWGQSYPYNKYCQRQNLIGKWKSALTGCSTTAMAMIVTHNEFPQDLTINNTLMEWDKMKTNAYGIYLSGTGKECVAHLMASIFANVKKIARKKYTLITPEQIVKRMKAFGYTNVKKHCGSNFTQEMIKHTSDMLADNKPVFISAIAGATNGHSWVIDGAKYSSIYAVNTYLLHFNFGWSGSSNGYFSTTCLIPSKAVEYDNMNIDNTTDNDHPYTWHFRLITYDIPNDIKSIIANYSY